jgi:hypothetical protein
MRKTTEELIYELENRYGNPKGPRNFDIVLEGLNRLKEVYAELQELKAEKK